MSAAGKPPAPKRARKPSPDSSAAVDAFMATLEHAARPEIDMLRTLFLGADARIAEGIKWNAPSFRTSEYFATTNLRARSGIGVILHLGAKVRALPAGGIAIDDPEGLLKWLAADRAMVEFPDRAVLVARQTALTAIIRQWIEYV